MTTRETLIQSAVKAKGDTATHEQLDFGYSRLTQAEKQAIVLSLRNKDKKAGDLIDIKFAEIYTAQATEEVDQYLTDGAFPLSVIENLISFLRAKNAN